MPTLVRFAKAPGWVLSAKYLIVQGFTSNPVKTGSVVLWMMASPFTIGKNVNFGMCKPNPKITRLNMLFIPTLPVKAE